MEQSSFSEAGSIVAWKLTARDIENNLLCFLDITTQITHRPRLVTVAVIQEGIWDFSQTLILPA